MNISTPFSLIHRGNSRPVDVYSIKENTFLSGTTITGNDVIEFENEVQCIFCSSLQWSYYAYHVLSYVSLYDIWQICTNKFIWIFISWIFLNNVNIIPWELYSLSVHSIPLYCNITASVVKSLYGHSHGGIHNHVKPYTFTLVFVASPLSEVSTQR